MEAPLFIKCEPPSVTDTEEPFNAECNCSNQVVIKVEPDIFINPSIKEESSEDIKEEQGDEDDAGECCDGGMEGKHHSEICPILPSAAGNDHITTPSDPRTSTTNVECQGHTSSKNNATIEKLKPKREAVNNLFGESETVVVSDDPLHNVESPLYLRNSAGMAEESSCEACGKRFPQRILYQRHLFEHTDSDPFRCNLCDKIFADRTKLRHHMYIHSKQRRYNCADCGKTYSRHNEYLAHSNTHTGEKPYSCKNCDKSFAHPNILHKHMRTHAKEKEYTCLHCDRTFTVKVYLKRHMLTHSRQKSFDCNVCGKLFLSRFNLKAHLLTHAGPKPHVCSLCGRSFVYRSTLRRHFLKHSR